MSVDISNAISLDLVKVVQDVIRDVEMKLRVNRDIDENIVPTESAEDLDILFEAFRNASTYIADKTSLYCTAITTDSEGNEVTIKQAAGLKEDQSGANSLRERFLTRKVSDIEVFEFPGKQSEQQRDVYYQYTIEALKRYMLYEWYLSLGRYEMASNEMTLSQRAISNLNNVSFRPSIVRPSRARL